MGAKKVKQELTREEWLHKAIKIFSEDLFNTAGYKVPKVRVSVGIPYGARGSGKRIGEHWHPDSSDDKVGCVFITPTIDDGLEVLGVLVHELVHAAVGNEAKHGPKFKKCAVAVGLEGPMKATTPNEELTKYIKETIKDIGEYPHSKLNILKRPVKKQSTRMIKMQCFNCDYIVRASLTKILEFGPVICPSCTESMVVDMPEDAEEKKKEADKDYDFL